MEYIMTLKKYWLGYTLTVDLRSLPNTENVQLEGDLLKASIAIYNKLVLNASGECSKGGGKWLHSFSAMRA